MEIPFKNILDKNAKKIEIVDRATGSKFTEKVYGDDAMKIFYGSELGAQITSKLLTNKILSNIYGAYNDSALSKTKIRSFVEAMNIDVSECDRELHEYQSFNDFFARKLRPDARPTNDDPNVVVSPSDGRLLVFPRIDDGTIGFVKWAPIPLLELFQNHQSLAQRYARGSAGILRLCPSDYHRVHFPVSGRAGITHAIPGVLHSVNPYALEQKIPVYCLNKRSMCELDSPVFGKVLIMEVGAMFVGSIVQTYRPNTDIQKGSEKGYFKFGGSTSIFFFEEKVMEFDADLASNSQLGLESYVRMGERIGISAAQT